MKRSVSLPLDGYTLSEYSGWADLRRELDELGCDGIEAIWGGEDLPKDIPAGLVTGYHLTFFHDWLDLYREDRAALERKFGSMEQVKAFYGGTTRETLLAAYRADLERAAALEPEYVVFHVSDVSVEEGYTYRWLHSHGEVIDVSIEVINTLLAGRDWPFTFLVENQWWPGFTFTDPKQASRLLDGICFEKKGILLDTGHLMNTNTALRTQEEGAAYISAMLDAHGELAKQILGVHLHQSLSGEYVRAHTGFLPDGLPAGPAERFTASYRHIQRIDRHEPWTATAVLPVLECLDPRWLTHELPAESRAKRTEAVRRQSALLGRLGT